MDEYEGDVVENGVEDGVEERDDSFNDGLEAGQRIIENELSMATRAKYRGVLRRFVAWLQDHYAAGLDVDGNHSFTCYWCKSWIH